MIRALAVLAVLAGCPQPKAEDTAPAKPQTPKEVVAAARGAIEEWRQAYEVRSIEALEKLYSHDLDVVLVQDGQPLIGWSSIDAMLKDRITRAKEIHVRLKDVQVTAVGGRADVASAVATMTREVSDGTTSVSTSGALTLVLRKDADGWHIVVEHYSYKRAS